jgi:cell division septal protein FtsQ
MSDPRGGRRNTAVVYAPVAFLLTVLLSAFGISVFFRVTRIDVIGASKYAQDEIMEQSGLETGGNLIFMNGAAAARRIRQLPYVRDAKIVRRLPDTLVIVVTESVPRAFVTADGVKWLIDSEARLLEPIEGERDEGIISVTGVTPVSPSPGTPMKVAAGSETRLNYLKDILREIMKKGLMYDVDELDVSNVSGITLIYRGITVVLGSGEDAGYKLDRMLETVDEARANDRPANRIDVSKYDKVTAG